MQSVDQALPASGLDIVAGAGDKGRRIRAIVGASSGNLVEWYDFYAYAFTSIYFAAAFFPTGDTTSQLMATAGIFAVGFFMRPLGGWLFGWIADTHGRKNSMVISVLMMCAGSLLIAILPTYATIGAAAPVLLLVARLVQGLSVGGEYGTAATYMSEVAGKGHRGFYSSFQYVTLIGGQLLALLVLVVLQALLSVDELKAWGWRIPFVIGAVTAVVAMYLRRSLVETGSEAAMHSKEAGSLRGLLKYKRSVLLVLAFTMGGSLYFYTFTTYMQKYLVNTAHMDAKVVSMVMTGVLVIYMLLQPVFGALSDRIGRRNNMLLFSGLATIASVPSAECPWTGIESLHCIHARAACPRDRVLLHVDQRRGEGGVVSGHGARAGRGVHVRGRQRAVRGHGRIRGVVAQVGRPRRVVCLVRHGAGWGGIRGVDAACRIQGGRATSMGRGSPDPELTAASLT